MSDWGTDQYEAQEVRLHNNVYRVTIRPLPERYTSGMQVRFKATATSTGALSLRIKGLFVNWLPEVAILRQGGTATVAGDVVLGQVVSLIYDGSAFRLQSTAAGEIPTAYVPPISEILTAQSLPNKKTALTFPHSLGAIPKRVRAVFVFVNADPVNGYNLNDEVSIESIITNYNDLPPFNVSADITNVYVSAGDTNDVYKIVPKAGGSYASTTNANWKIKVYVSL